LIFSQEPYYALIRRGGYFNQQQDYTFKKQQNQHPFKFNINNKST